MMKARCHASGPEAHGGLSAGLGPGGPGGGRGPVSHPVGSPA